jgi:hypothetical protein
MEGHILTEQSKLSGSAGIDQQIPLRQTSASRAKNGHYNYPENSELYVYMQ